MHLYSRDQAAEGVNTEDICLDVSAQCPVVQLIHLRTITAPTAVTIFQKTSRGETNVTDAFLGPYNEGSQLVLVCEAGGGRPTPSVLWRLGWD